jgi:hypothetical protein
MGLNSLAGLLFGTDMARFPKRIQVNQAQGNALGQYRALCKTLFNRVWNC